MYRIASDLAPHATHPHLPPFHPMVRDARRLGTRLSFHPSQFIVLNSPDSEPVRRSTLDLLSQAESLDRMELGLKAVLVIQVAGQHGDRASSRARWVQTWWSLPEPVRRRLVLEHDDIRFSAADVLRIHGETGGRLIVDHPISVPQS